MAFHSTSANIMIVIGSMSKAIWLLLALPKLGLAQTLVVGGEVYPATDQNVAPAFELVDPTSSNATAPLFDSETHILTDKALKNLTDLQLTNIVLFAFPGAFEEADLALKQELGGPCKTFSDDFVGFPGRVTNAVFNLLLGGSLIQTKPFAAPCYSDFDNENAAECAEINSNWYNDSYIHTNDPTSINAILFQGTSCVPHSVNPYAEHCTLGSYPRMSIRATTVAEVQLAVNLARNLNLRLVIKNTGHDFSAKSTGAGGVSIWTHNMKEIKFYEEYEEGSYKGPAFKMGAGVQVYEAYEAAHTEGVTIVGGEGRTVGLTGGYILGGGYSPLSSLWGMAADQVLSMEVITADGRFVTASETSNPDLFWALRGGGGSTFGVVTSMVIRAYPKIPVTTMTMGWSTGPDVSIERFWSALHAYFDGFVNYTDAGTYGYFSLGSVDGDYVFKLRPWFAPNMSRAELEALAAPFLSELTDTLGIPLDDEPEYAEYGSFYEAWDASFPLERWGTNLGRSGSRLFPRSSWADPEKLSLTLDVIRFVLDSGGSVTGVTVAGSPLGEGGKGRGEYPDNAVNPAWRETVLHAISHAEWQMESSTEIIEFMSYILTHDWGKAWSNASPGAGAYLSESDYIEPDFQQSFWGDKYERLRDLKKRLDPWDLFYAQNAVGSEDWEMSEFIFGILPSQNSRLCRKGTSGSARR